MKRVGIFGGSFDPPHQAHHEIATIAINRIPLDKLYLVPAWISLLKDHSPRAAAGHRLAMTKLLTAGLPKAEVLTYELDQQRAVPTLETVRYMRKLEGPSDCFLIIGGDQAARFASWLEWRKLLEIVQVVCFRRAGPPPDKGLLPHITFIEYENGLTSTSVRSQIRDGKVGTDIMSPPLADYIQRFGLYQ